MVQTRLPGQMGLGAFGFGKTDSHVPAFKLEVWSNIGPFIEEFNKWFFPREAQTTLVDSDATSTEGVLGLGAISGLVRQGIVDFQKRFNKNLIPSFTGNLTRSLTNWSYWVTEGAGHLQLKHVPSYYLEITGKKGLPAIRKVEGQLANWVRAKSAWVRNAGVGEGKVRHGKGLSSSTKFHFSEAKFGGTGHAKVRREFFKEQDKILKEFAEVNSELKHFEKRRREISTRYRHDVGGRPKGPEGAVVDKKIWVGLGKSPLSVYFPPWEAKDYESRLVDNLATGAAFKYDISEYITKAFLAFERKWMSKRISKARKITQFSANKTITSFT